MSRPTLRFLACGDWSAGRVTQAWVPGGRRRLPAIDAAIDTAWVTAAARAGVRLFDGPMCRLERWSASPDRLHVDLSPTSYKPFVGTNMVNPSLADTFGTDVMANPVGVSTAVVSGDGFLLLGRRNGRVAYYPNRTHPFAGALEPTDTDVFAAVARELSEELSLAPAGLVDVRCTGLAEDLSLRQPELIFAAVTTTGLGALVAGLDPDEHAGTWSVAATADAVARAIDAERDQLTPIAAAALLLWGRLRFGDDWFATAAAPVVLGPETA